MKAIDVLNEATTDFFNRMNLEPFGDYAGEYQNEAYDFFEENYPEVIEGLSNENAWCDVMTDSGGKTYAVMAEDSLTCDCNVAFVEVEM